MSGVKTKGGGDGGGDLALRVGGKPDGEVEPEWDGATMGGMGRRRLGRMGLTVCSGGIWWVIFLIF